MNTSVNCGTVRPFAAPTVLRLAVPLIILVLLAAGCGGAPPPPPATANWAETAAPEAAPAPTVVVPPAPVCDEPAPSVLAIWGNEDTNPNFQSIANSFVMDAGRTSGFGQTSWPAGTGFAEDMNQHTIGFYTGHGSPTTFDVLASVGVTTAITITSLSPLGQCDAGAQDQLRYLMFASCNTFAHGPKDCSDPKAQDYACPGEWLYDPAGDNEAMRSIYTRWGPALGSGLRIACGMSTDAPPENATGLWSEYGFRSVADAVAASLSLQNDVAMCIARGGRDFADSPLMQDSSFITESNPFDDGPEVYYHIQYGKPFADPYKPVHGVLVGEDQVEDQVDLFNKISQSFPECLPVLGYDPAAPQRRGDPSKQDKSLTGFASEAEALGKTESEKQFIEYALQGLDELDFENPGLDADNAYASGIYLMMTTFPADPAQQNQEALRVAVKNVIITFPQLFAFDEVGGIDDLGRSQDFERLGSFYDIMQELFPVERWAAPRRAGQPLMRLWGQDIQVQLNADGSPISGTSKWQATEGIKAISSERVLTPFAAFLKSLDQLGLDPLGIGADGESPYRLEAWEWGYGYDELGYPPESRIWYRFRFGPNQAAGYDASTHPPVYEWVRGQQGEYCPSE